jgi:hypothetical protein
LGTDGRIRHSDAPSQLSDHSTVPFSWKHIEPLSLVSADGEETIQSEETQFTLCLCRCAFAQKQRPLPKEFIHGHVKSPAFNDPPPA